MQLFPHKICPKFCSISTSKCLQKVWKYKEIRRKNFTSGWQSAGAGCPERWCVLFWRYSKPVWAWSGATCSGWPCSSRGGGLVDLQRSLPAPTALWVCGVAYRQYVPVEALWGFFEGHVEGYFGSFYFGWSNFCHKGEKVCNTISWHFQQLSDCPLLQVNTTQEVLALSCLNSETSSPGNYCNYSELLVLMVKENLVFTNSQ